MEGERRKRKLEDEEEENEEQKMEKFFALIRSTKDLLSKEKTDNKVEEKKEKGIWNPTFQLEDFIGCGEVPVGKTSVSVTEHHAGPSEKEKEVTIEKENLQEETITEAAAAEENEVNEKASDPLDLNLSL